MTKEELTALLRNPDQTGQAVDELNRLIEENPYFHTGHQLYLKGLQQTNEKKMALQLGKTALSVRDRGVLYNYLNRPSSFRREPSPQDKPSDVSVPYIPGNSYVSPEADIHNIQHAQPEPPSPGMHPLTMGGGWHNREEEDIIVEEKIMSDNQLMDVVRRRLEQITPQVEEDSQVPTVTETNVATTGDAADPINIAPTKTNIAETSPQDVVSQDERPGDVVVTGEKKELTSGNLIDSFLKTNPKIIPSDSKYEVDLSESLQENPDVATETLADIYAMQGHKDKAIEIYEHLILKYPEKHIYFAAQIDRLKE
jgi:tetratricopeptide (TPR) repeat protein